MVGLVQVGRSLLPFVLLAERYGLDGKPPRSVRESAALHGLSRSGVRAQEARALAALAGALRSGA